MNNFNWDLFLNEGIVVFCKEKRDVRDFQYECICKKIKWSSGKEIKLDVLRNTDNNIYFLFDKEKNGICLLSYDDEGEIEKAYEEVYNWKQLFKSPIDFYEIIMELDSLMKCELDVSNSIEGLIKCCEHRFSSEIIKALKDSKDKADKKYSVICDVKDRFYDLHHMYYKGE